MQEESFIAISDEMLPLVERFGRELGKVTVAPDWLGLFRMTASGVLRTTTARYDGALVGFALNIVGPHLLYHTTTFGITNAMWLDRAYRGGWQGYKFLRANRDNLKTWGATIAYIARDLTKGDDRLEAVYRRLGYQPDELMYMAAL